MSLMLPQGKLATVMRRTVKGGGGGSKGSAAGTAGQPSNITWYGPGKQRAGPQHSRLDCKSSVVAGHHFCRESLVLDPTSKMYA